MQDSTNALNYVVGTVVRVRSSNQFDLFVANDTQPNKLYKNNGNGTGDTTTPAPKPKRLPTSSDR